MAIDVIDATSDFLWKTKRVILVPILYFIINILVFVTWAVAFAGVLSLNKIKADKLHTKDLEWTGSNRGLALYMIFGLFWLTAFM